LPRSRICHCRVARLFPEHAIWPTVPSSHTVPMYSQRHGLHVFFFAFVLSCSAVRCLDRSLRPKCHLFIRSIQARRHSRCTASRSRRAARDASSSCIYGDSVFNPRRPCSGALVSPLPREEKARALFPSPICAPKDCGHVPGVC